MIKSRKEFKEFLKQDSLVNNRRSIYRGTFAVESKKICSLTFQM